MYGKDWEATTRHASHTSPEPGVTGSIPAGAPLLVCSGRALLSAELPFRSEPARFPTFRNHHTSPRFRRSDHGFALMEVGAGVGAVSLMG
jgi:hypothetical protein